MDAWLAHINELDPAIIADVIAKCGAYADTMDYCLDQARQVPTVPERD